MNFLSIRNALRAAMIVFTIGMVSCTKDENDAPSPVSSEPTSSHRTVDERILYKFPYELDVDLDGAPDYVMGSKVEGDGLGLRMTFYAEALRGNEIMSDGEGGLVALRIGEKVDAGDPNWSSITTLLAEKYSENGSVTWKGAWKDDQLHYLPIRFRSGSAMRIGWLSMTVETANHEIVLHELAFDLTGANNILTGDQ
ncbi:MAG: hypothetical protein IT270_12205 [Saprospiraceae bacterium]|nr:hypothetical protein [Saprospiraceae bacterium]